MKFKPYCREINYYETDKMAIMHHSNYFRLFEEARLDHMKQCGIPYPAVEDLGIIIPVVDIHAKYSTSLKYGDVAEITVKATRFSGVKIFYGYEVRIKDSGELSATGDSCHCFLDEDRLPLNMKKAYPDIYRLLKDSVE